MREEEAVQAVGKYSHEDTAETANAIIKEGSRQAREKPVEKNKEPNETEASI